MKKELEKIKELKKQQKELGKLIVNEENDYYEKLNKRKEKKQELGIEISELEDNLNGGRNTIKFPKTVTITKNAFDTHGGGVSFEIPKDCDLIILCGNSGGGYQPYQCLLPHQVYIKDLKETFKEKHFEVITIIPVKSDTAMDIAYNGMYGEQRWGKKI